MSLVIIRQPNTKIRLDQFLTQKYPDYSRAFLKEQIREGKILINGKIKKPAYILKENDQVKIKISSPKKYLLEPNKNIKLNIIYEDKNIIAIDKPAGLSVHPAKPEQKDTLTNALLAYYAPIKDVGDLSTDSEQVCLRPGIVHRLDKETSGLMVIAKTQEAFDWLKKQFQERNIEKKYLALIVGHLKNDRGIISKPIGRTKGSLKRTTAPISDTKEAITKYQTIKKFKNFTLIEAEPKTGRTHQIRVHFASIGHPLAGDNLYGFKKQLLPKGLKRHFLHASYLKFSLSDGKILELSSKLPDDLRRVLANLQPIKKI